MDSKIQLVPELRKPETLIEIEKIPKEFHWLVMLKRIETQYYSQNKPMFFEFYYREDGQLVKHEKPKMIMDSEHQSFIPQVPEQVAIIEHKMGRGLVETERFEGVSDIDPDIDTAMVLFNLAGSF